MSAVRRRTWREIKSSIYTALNKRDPQGSNYLMRNHLRDPLCRKSNSSFDWGEYQKLVARIGGPARASGRGILPWRN